MSFIMTLPIKRKTYVQEKYVFAGVSTLIACIGSSILAMVLGILRNVPMDMRELAAVAYVVTLMAWFVLAIAIPMQIKFGAEKGRIAMMLTIGGIVAVVTAAAKVLENKKGDMTGVIGFIERLGIFEIIVLSLLVTVLVLGISYWCCVHIINKKEY